MPNFARHQQVCYEWLILLLTIYSAIITRDFIIPLFIVGYIIGTNYITPDLDTGSTPFNKHKSTWYIFKKLSKHRGSSHNIIIGIFPKLIYLILLSIPIIYMFGIFMNDNTLLWRTIERTIELTKIYYIYIISLLSGMVVSNGIHIIQDRMN